MPCADIPAQHAFTQDQPSCDGVDSHETDSTGQLKFDFRNSLADLEADWLELEQKSNCSPFQKYSWIKALYHGVENNSQLNTFSHEEPLIVSGYLDAKLVLILPMMLETNLFGKRLKWVGSEASDYNGLILDPDYASKISAGLFDHLIKQIRKNVTDLDAIYLTRNPEPQNVFEVKEGGLATRWRSEYSSHTLELSRDWKSRYAQIRSKKTRQRLNSKFRSLKCSGNITFKQVRNLDKKLEATRQILDWKSDQLQERGCRNPFGNEELPSQTRLAINASVKDSGTASIRVFGLFRNNVLIAGMLAFIDNGNFFYLVSAYSPEMPNKFSVGTQLLVKTIELASRAGLQKYDFLIGDEAYKSDWCDASVPLSNLLIPFTFMGRVFGTGLQIQHVMKKRIMQSPAASRFARQLMNVARSENPSLSFKARKEKPDTDTGFTDTQIDLTNSNLFADRPWTKESA